MLYHRSYFLGGKVGPELFCIFEADTWLVQSWKCIVFKLARQKYWPYFSCYTIAVFQGPGPACSCSSCKNINIATIQYLHVQSILPYLLTNSSGDLTRANWTEVIALIVLNTILLWIQSHHAMCLSTAILLWIQNHHAMCFSTAAFLGVRFSVNLKFAFLKFPFSKLADKQSAHRGWRSGPICLTAHFPSCI